jgi:WD40 repeat protein
VAAASEDGVRVLDPMSGDEVFAYTPRDWWPTGLAWSPDGSLLAVAGHDDGGTAILDLTGREVGRVQEEGAYVPISVAFSPDGTVLAVGRAPSDVQLGVWGITVWDWRAKKALSAIDAEAQHLTFTHEGLLINADRRGPVLVSNPATGEAVARLTGHTGGTLSLDLSPDGTLLATVGRDGTVRLWETVNWTEQLALPGHQGSAISVRFNADGRRLATLGDEGMTRVWAIDLESLLRIAETKVTRTLSAEECLQYLHLKECA